MRPNTHSVQSEPDPSAPNLRAAPIWVYNFENDHYSVPVGIGYGKVIKKGYGTGRVTLDLLWLKGNRFDEVTNTEKVGGKGIGGGAKQKTRSYFATFMVGASELLVGVSSTQTISASMLGMRLPKSARGRSRNLR